MSGDVAECARCGREPIEPPVWGLCVVCDAYLAEFDPSSRPGRGRSDDAPADQHSIDDYSEVSDGE